MWLQLILRLEYHLECRMQCWKDAVFETKRHSKKFAVADNYVRFLLSRSIYIFLVYFTSWVSYGNLQSSDTLNWTSSFIWTTGLRRLPTRSTLSEEHESTVFYFISILSCDDRVTKYRFMYLDIIFFILHNLMMSYIHFWYYPDATRSYCWDKWFWGFFKSMNTYLFDLVYIGVLYALFSFHAVYC